MEPPAIQHCRSRDGLRVSYRVTGEGPPLLLVHGLTMQAATWQPYIDRLATRFHVIALDLRGHSGSDRPHDPAAYALDRVIQDLHAVLQAVHVERAHCWGYSLGARILLTAINDAPNRFARVVLGGSHAAALDPQALAAQVALLGQDIDAYLAAQSPPLSGAARRQFLQNDPAALAALQQARLKWPALPSLPKQQTLIYAGANDPRAGPAQALAKSLPHATFLPIPGADHVSAFARHDLILDTATTFLRSS